ncbi:Uncharacterised protein [Chromobacterium violaceum]|uniref:Uncharacterized protein n=1 Tax=Chromobacterium violaceum TaxID=536 RepID=A0A447T9J3_CHRVL|nr:Uncharacterised protein [Chromobacterium violaceum]
MLQSAVQAALAWHQTEHRDMAMVEAFIFAGAGVFSGRCWSASWPPWPAWRWTLLAAALALVLILPLPALPAGRNRRMKPEARARGVPLAVALCWISVLLA